ncbi:hypothetical protein EDB86DRAFT_1179444 [Lactarius hatsudake]|nr:hypothetical protein EDB86DRAFT_1179444 [Lactarius hatsudake]
MPMSLPPSLSNWLWASLFSPASRGDTTRAREQDAQYEATHQFSGSTGHLPCSISLPPIASRETNTTQDHQMQMKSLTGAQRGRRTTVTGRNDGVGGRRRQRNRQRRGITLVS